MKDESTPTPRPHPLLLLVVDHPRPCPAFILHPSSFHWVPGRVLGEGEHLPPARRADLLVVPTGHLVLVTQLGLDLDQVADVGRRRVRLVTAKASGGLLLLADGPVELDGE